MRVLEGDPADLIGADAVLLGENAAQPHARGLAVSPHPDAAAGEVGGTEDPAVGAAQQGGLLEPGRRDHRQEDQRLAPRLGLEEGRDRHLANIEALLAHHGREGAVDHRDVGEVQAQPVGRDAPGFQRLDVPVIADRRAQHGPARGHDAIPFSDRSS